MRVLHCIHSLQGGGAERQLMLLANDSSSHDMTAAVACVDATGREGLAQHVELYGLRRRRKLDALLLADALTAIDRFRPDVVHAWLPAVVTIPAMLAARLRRVPVLFSYRMSMKNDAPLKPLEWLVAAACAAGIISNTNPEWCTKSYQWLFRRKRGVVIANGVVANTAAFNCSARTGHAGPMRLLFAGRLSAQKNVVRLLEAMAMLASRCDVMLTICGRGEHQVLIERRIGELALQDHVKLVGFQPDLRNAMPTYDALVMPSLWEGMPNVVLEAMAAGLPCIVSDIPEHRLVCGPAGTAQFFDPASTAALVDAVSAVAKSLDRRRAMSDAGLARSAEFSVSNMVASHREAYKVIMANAAADLGAVAPGRRRPAAGR
jgi:glycosyltransferase involved in cell wall biosynthesis